MPDDAAEAATGTGEAAGCWYYEEPTTKQPAGPWTVSQLAARWRRNRLDGCTRVWRAGLEGWQLLAEVPELKEALREAEAGAEAEAEAGADAEEAAPRRRVPLDEVPIIHTYTSDQGMLYVYDVVDEDWKACDVYEAILAEEKEDVLKTPADGVADAALKSSSNVEEDDAMQQLLHETDGLGTTLLVSNAPTLGRSGAAESTDLAAAEENIDPEKRLKREKKREYRERKKLKKQAGLFMKAQDNPNVYVSSLPANVTISEMEGIFKRAGVLKVDPESGDAKIRIYKEADGVACRGDALVTYANSASVALALEFLHELEIRPGCRICVQQADFDGHSDGPKLSKEELKSLASKRKNDVERSKYLAAKNAQKEAISWSGEMDDGTGRRIIVLRRMYTLEEAEGEGPSFYTDLEQEVRDECAKIGQVLKVTPIERHRQGIVCVKFKTSCEAEECIRVMDGRFFAGRTIEASFYDGRTNLKAIGLADGQDAVPPSASDGAQLPASTAQASEETAGDDEAPAGTKSYDAWLDDQSSDSDEEFKVRVEE